jgi:hypothetical protein
MITQKTLPDANLHRVGLIMTNLKLDPEKHKIWAHNMAHNLDGLSPELADRFVSHADEVVLPEFDPTAVPDWGGRDSDAQRPLEKSLRDLHQPYTDQQVAERLDKVTGETLRLIDRMKVLPSRMFVIGSLNKGRFGGNSDVDLLCLSNQLLEFEGAPIPKHRCDDLVGVLRTTDTLLPDALGFAGAYVEVKPETLRDTLRNTWQSGLHKVNLAVEVTPRGHVSVTQTGPRVAVPEQPWDLRRESGLVRPIQDAAQSVPS